MARHRFSTVIMFSVGFITALLMTLLWVTSASPVLAGRVVLNQPFETIEHYFGRPLEDVETTANYSTEGIRQLFPDFPEAGEFEITFVNGKAQWIRLMPNASEEDYFTFDRPQALQLFEYIFGYPAPTWQSLLSPAEETGHEGFTEHEYCLGDGIAIAFIQFRLGADMINLYYKPVCEPPYQKS